MARFDIQQRKMICGYARKRMRYAWEVAAVHAKQTPMPDSFQITAEACEALGWQEALQTISPGRWRHGVEVAERMARRFGRKNVAWQRTEES